MRAPRPSAYLPAGENPVQEKAIHHSGIELDDRRGNKSVEARGMDVSGRNALRVRECVHEDMHECIHKCISPEIPHIAEVDTVHNAGRQNRCGINGSAISDSAGVTDNSMIQIGKYCELGSSIKFLRR